MKNLDANWITEGWIDFELKQYVLLDYLQKVQRSFKNKNLYPILSDLVFHYNNLVSLRDNNNILSKQIPRKLDKIDLQKLKLVYKKVDLPDNSMSEIEKVIDFAIPLFREHLQAGKNLYEWVEDQLEMETIGLRPLYDKEGYLFLSTDEMGEVMIYQYKLSQIKNNKDGFYALQTELIGTETKSVANHYNNLKLKLLKNNKELPNPAAFVINAKKKLPYKNTLLPVAERMLMRNLNLSAA